MYADNVADVVDRLLIYTIYTEDCPMMHGYLYRCYTEVRAQHIADWMGMLVSSAESQVMSLGINTFAR